MRSVSTLLLIMIVSSCTPDRPVSPSQGAGYPEQVGAAQTAEAQFQFARDLAVALSDRELKAELLTLLQSSDAVDFSVPLMDLLTSGNAISRSVASARGVRGAGWAAGFEVLMPSPIHRRSWTPDAPITVAFSRPGGSDLLEVFDSSGESVEMRRQSRADKHDALLLIRPRTKQPRQRVAQRGRGIETVEDSTVPVLATLGGDCVPHAPPTGLAASNGDCDEPDPPTTCEVCDEWSVPVDFVCTPSQIFSVTIFTDSDADGVRDYCEEQLARVFEPLLQFHPGEDTSGREPKFAAQRMPFGTGMAIAYLLSYYEDGGYWWGSAHPGDSEFIVVELGPDGPNWRIYQVLTSAHFRAFEPGSEWNPPEEFPSQYAPRPRVLVAENKHANYATFSECYFMDDCSAAGALEDAMVGYWINIGSASHPFDIDPGLPGVTSCTRSLVTLQSIECFRNDGHSFDSFKGWIATSTDGAPLYGEILGYLGF